MAPTSPAAAVGAVADLDLNLALYHFVLGGSG